MSWTPVDQIALTTYVGATAAGTFGVTPQAGDLLVVFDGSYDGLTDLVSVAATGCTVTRRKLQVTGSRRADIWRATQVGAGNPTVTATVNNTIGGALPRLSAYLFRPTTTFTDDATDGDGASASATVLSGTVSPTPGRSLLVFAAFFDNGSNANAGPTNGFTALTAHPHGGAGAAYKIVSASSGAYSTGWGFAGNEDSSAAVVSFVEAAPSDGPLMFLRLNAAANAGMTLRPTITNAVTLQPSANPVVTVTPLETFTGF